MSIFVFDMDGTLTPARLPMKSDFAEVFKSWQQNHLSFIATGSDYKKVQEQMPESVINGFTGVYCSMGNMLIKQGQIEYEKSFDAPSGLLKDLENFRRNSSYPGQKYDNYIEKRVGMINFSVLGRNCPYEARVEYAKWDKEFNERLDLQKQLISRYPQLEITVGGAISIDITNQGCGKGQVARHLRQMYPDDEIIFFGDKTFVGGNDYELAHELSLLSNTRTIQVSGPDEVLKILLK